MDAPIAQISDWRQMFVSDPRGLAIIGGICVIVVIADLVSTLINQPATQDDRHRVSIILLRIVRALGVGVGAFIVLQLLFGLGPMIPVLFAFILLTILGILGAAGDLVSNAIGQGIDHQVLQAITVAGLIAGVTGSLFLAYDLLGGRRGPLRRLTQSVTTALLASGVLGILAVATSGLICPDPACSLVYTTAPTFGYVPMLILIGGVGGALLGIFFLDQIVEELGKLADNGRAKSASVDDDEKLQTALRNYLALEPPTEASRAELRTSLRVLLKQDEEEDTASSPDLQDPSEDAIELDDRPDKPRGRVPIFSWLGFLVGVFYALFIGVLLGLEFFSDIPVIGQAASLGDLFNQATQWAQFLFPGWLSEKVSQASHLSLPFTPLGVVILSAILAPAVGIVFGFAPALIQRVNTVPRQWLGGLGVALILCGFLAQMVYPVAQISGTLIR